MLVHAPALVPQPAEEKTHEPVRWLDAAMLPRKWIVGDLHVDMLRHQVRKGNKLLKLTWHCYRSFAYLVIRKDDHEPVTVLELESWLHDDGHHCSTNTVPTLITYVRKELLLVKSNVLILNFRAKGYVLKVAE